MGVEVPLACDLPGLALDEPVLLAGLALDDFLRPTGSVGGSSGSKTRSFRLFRSSKKYLRSVLGLKDSAVLAPNRSLMSPNE